MQLKFHNYSMSSILGLIAFITFTIFILTSVALYPTNYNPLYDWLSNLGNINLNPMGAFFFNWGCIISGIILIPFFIGLYAWKPQKTLQKSLLILGMVIGIFASISLIMVGIYPETHIIHHVQAATAVFSSLFLIIIVINLALYENPKFIRGVAYFGILAVLVDIIFSICSGIEQEHISSFQSNNTCSGFRMGMCIFITVMGCAFSSEHAYKKSMK